MTRINSREIPSLDTLNSQIAGNFHTRRRGTGYLVKWYPNNDRRDVAGIFTNPNVRVFVNAGMILIGDNYYTYLSDSQYDSLPSAASRMIKGKIHIHAKEEGIWQQNLIDLQSNRSIEAYDLQVLERGNML